MEIYGSLVDLSMDGAGGMEGIHWSVRKAAVGFSKGVQIEDYWLLGQDDFLEVYDPSALYVNGTHMLIWSGYIQKDFKSNLMEFSSRQGVERQYVCDKKVNWLQKGFGDHEQWYWLFALNYPAKLVCAGSK